MDKASRKYDYLIVGSGLFGSTIAYFLKKNKKKLLIIDKREHIGGNIYTEKIENINIHKYGPHIFHTDDKEVWDFVNNFCEFNHFRYEPLANYNGEIYNLPFNMNTFHQMWKNECKTPKDAEMIINIQKNIIKEKPKNLEEQAISLVGKDIYEKLIKGYTEKQWGRACKDLPSFIIKRIPVRYRYDNNYFNHPYQGIPIGGYTKIIEKMIEGVEIKLSVDYFDNREYFDSIANKIIFTGQIDEYYNYKFGHLQYRSLRFENETFDTNNYQGVAGMNFTDINTPYTRIIEHKHFEFGNQNKTIITKEYPLEWKPGLEPYYPINDEKNSSLYNKYYELSKKEKNVIFGGRLAEYKYYDMDKTIRSAMNKVKELLGEY